MGIEIICHKRDKGLRIPRVRRSAAQALELLGRRDVELCVALVGDREMRELNRRFRGMDRTTDVLSFPADDPSIPEPRLLGDVVISVGEARKVAKRRFCRVEEAVEILLVHGILHLLGYDHERSAKDAKIMHGTERRLLAALSRNQG